jgi:hypothetical protein
MSNNNNLEVLLVSRKAPEDFHKFLNKFGSQNIAKLVLFKHSRETSNAQGAFCKSAGCLLR